MTFGCYLHSRGKLARPENLVASALRAEALGFTSIWVSDHVVIPRDIASPYPYSNAKGGNPFEPRQPYFEVLTLMSYLAASTKKILIGTHVLILPYRNPVLAAKMISTVDVLSGGRVILGIGVGWMAEEFQALGAPDFAKRGAVSDEYIQIFKTLWTQDEVAFSGEHYQFDALECLPKPLQKPHPPIWVGGHTKAAISRAARLGDAWLPTGLRTRARLEPAELAEKIATLKDFTSKAGRDPEDVQVCFSASIDFATTVSPSEPRPLMTGEPDDIASDIQAYREIGVTHFTFNFAATDRIEDSLSAMERFAEEVMPKVK